MTDWPRITIVTPTKNSEKYLQYTIQSVLEQNYPNLEYIIIDGCSTDGTIDIIRHYEEYLSYWESSPDRNMYDAVAKGFDRATGRILGWINSDDLLEAGCLHKVGKHFLEKPNQKVIYFENIVEKDGWWIPNRPHVNIGFGELLDCYIVYQDGVFFERKAYESVGGLNRELFVAGDYDLWLRLSRRYRFYRCPGHLSCFRLVPRQLSMSNWERYMNEVKKCRDELRSQLGKFELKKAIIEKNIRKVPNIVISKCRRRLWPIKNENYPWVPVESSIPHSIQDCKCPVCEGFPHRLLFSSPDTDTMDRRIWRVYECKECNLAFTFPKPNKPILREFYKRVDSRNVIGIHPAHDEYYSPYRRQSLISNKIVSIFERIFQFLSKYGRIQHDGIVPIKASLSSTILDIGCHEGRMLEYLRDQGYKKLYGIESNRKAANVARSKGFAVNCDDATLSDWLDVPIDVIILNQVLEQMSDPVNFIKSISRFLSSKGCIYLSTPNYDSAFIDFYGPAWGQWHLPFHFFIPSRRTIKRIAKMSGFNIKWFKTSTSTHQVYISDALSRIGLGGHVSHVIDNKTLEFPYDWEKAKGVTVISRLFIDPFLRGDCLYAKLAKNV